MPVTWAARRGELAAIRRAVFVDEQHVPENLEWDGLDEAARHVLALAPGGAPIGCGRLLADGHIGRMAVLAAHRGRGVGTALLNALLGLARADGHRTVFLDAQVHAIGFYRRLGFIPDGPEFMDAGIPHRHMTRPLP
ncbi:MAG: GNAT family N-acetyltransferase [Nitrospirae bacterium]|nr:GNAT family N-acetyltransferase [Nitrospirota bacterium]